MRALLCVLALAACGSSDGTCEVDDDCGGDVCARNGECLPSSAVRTVRLAWTLDGQPANATTCASTPDLYVIFYSTDPNDSFGYAPVPCDAGVFTMDKLPTRYTSAELGAQGGNNGVEQAITASGELAFDLP